MKKTILLLILILLCVALPATLRNMKLYTNTTYMRDIALYENRIVLSTWGGLEFFDPRTNTFETMTSFNGLNGNNISGLAVFNNELLIGVVGSGVDRLISKTIHPLSITSSLGLTSLRTNYINTYDNLIFVASDDGLAVFEQSVEFVFPLIKNAFTHEKGMPFISVNSVIVHDNGYVFLATDAGFSYGHVDEIQDNKWIHVTLTEDESVSHIDIKNNIVALATSKKLIYFHYDDINNPQNWKTELIDTPLARVHIEIINNDSFKIFTIIGEWDNLKNIFTNKNENRLAILTVNGLTQTNIEILTNSVFDFPVTDILISDKRIYLTTWGGGIYVTDYLAPDQSLKSAIWNNIKPNSIHTNAVTKIASERDRVWIIDGVPRGGVFVGSASGVSFLTNSTDSWTHYTETNSGLNSNNVHAIDIDARGRKWFGSWWMDSNRHGISVLDDSDPNNLVWGRAVTGQAINAISRVGNDMWVGTNENPVYIVNDQLQTYRTFTTPAPNQRNKAILHTPDRAYIGGRDGGVYVWNSSNLPETSSNNWSFPFLLRSGESFQFAVYDGVFFSQVWFATTQGVVYSEIRGNNVSWYKVDSTKKREKILDNGTTAPEQNNPTYYYVNEERVFGAGETYPSAVVIDNQARVWMASRDRGISMYDIQQDTYTNFTTSNSPLHTNDIVALNFQESTGLLLIGTNQGLLTAQISSGIPSPNVTTLGDVVVYPNPFRPELGERFKIEVLDSTLPHGHNECRIFDVSGQQVTVLEKSNEINGFIWDGNNQNKNKCASGTYFYLIRTDAGDAKRGTIVLIR